MIELLLIPYMALMSAWSGGSLWPSQYLPKKLTWVPEAFFALGFAYPFLFLKGWYLLFLIPIVAWSYIWMQSATAPGLHWGNGNYNPERTSTLKPFVDWLNKKTIDVHPSTKEYCWLYMGVKGFLITLPVGGIIGAVLWPAGYELGHRLNNHTIRELAAGAGAGIAIVVFSLLI